MEPEKKLRREIANSNERRRMQSINAGFQTLRDLLPQTEGEKLSKAAILQQISEFIYSLEQEKTRLLTQNCQLKRLLGEKEMARAASSKSISAPQLQEDKKPILGGSSLFCSDEFHSNDAASSVCSSVSARFSFAVDEINVAGHSATADEASAIVALSTWESANLCSLNTAPVDKNELPNSNVKLIEDLRSELGKEKEAKEMLQKELQHIQEYILHSRRNFVPLSSMEHDVDKYVPPHKKQKFYYDENFEYSSGMGYENVDVESGHVYTCHSAGTLHDDVSSERNFCLGSEPSNTLSDLKNVKYLDESNSVIANGCSVSSMLANPLNCVRTGHHLDTIVEAIRHLEGDHLFRGPSDSGVVEGSNTREAQKTPSVSLSSASSLIAADSPQDVPLALITHSRDKDNFRSWGNHVPTKRAPKILFHDVSSLQSSDYLLPPHRPVTRLLHECYGCGMCARCS